MLNQFRRSPLEAIKENIARFGYHTYLVLGGPSPRFSYAIGLNPRLGAEMIFAGGSIFSAEDVGHIVGGIVEKAEAHVNRQEWRVDLSSYGSFVLRKAHESWTRMMMLGALDFYGGEDITALQIVPDEAHRTIDVPDLSVPWAVVSEPIWKWMREAWLHPVSSGSVATTNLAALRGGRITEAARWEEDQWELFAGAGPDAPRDEIRTVPLATLLAADASLLPVVNLQVGSAAWRDVDSDWHSWGARALS